jgi:hypothetical protein
VCDYVVCVCVPWSPDTAHVVAISSVDSSSFQCNVTCLREGVSHPPCDSRSIAALDYLLTFALLRLVVYRLAPRAHNPSDFSFSFFSSPRIRMESLSLILP